MSPHGTVSLPPVENKEEEAANTTMSLPPIGRSGYINQAFEKSVGDFQKLPKVSALDDCADVNVEGKLLDFDDVLPHIGEFGVYQKVLFLLMIPYAFFVAFVYFTQIFITVAPEEHWCWVPELAHLTPEQRLNLAIPQAAPSETDKSFIHSHCTRYDVNFTQLLEDGLDLTPDPSWPVIPCDNGWEFDFSEIPYASITAEMEWVCQNAALPSVAQAIFFCGAIVGGLIFGWMADRYGRISALTGTNVVGCIAGVGTAFVTNFWQFCICRFLVGLAFDNCFTMMYILVLEYVGPKWRTFVANMSIAIFFTTATCMLPWIAYYLADWRMLCIATSAPLALAILTPWALPESARWLVSQGRVTKAIGIMQKFERINGKKVDPQIYKDFSDSCTKLQAEEDADKNYSVIDLFRTPHLRKITILLILIWMAISLVFDGHVRNVGSLGLDLFLTFTVASATELPADTFLTVVLDRWGRRWLSFGTMVFSGLFSLAAAAVPSGVYSATLAILGRFCVNISYNIGLQYAAELLPTVVRAQGVAFIHIMGYVASIVAPFVVYLASISQTLPLIILGVLGIVGGALCLFLPETLDEELPQTLNDGENFGKDQQFWEFPCVGRKEIVEDVEEPPLPFKRADFSSLHHTGASLRASTRGELSSTLLQRSARASVRSVRSIRSVHSMKSDGSSTDRSNSVHTLTGLAGGGRASLRASTRGELSSSLLQRSSSIRRSVRSVRSLKSDEAGNECAIGATGSTNAAPVIPKSVAMISHAKSISPLAAGANHPIATSSVGAIHGASAKGISPLTIAPNASVSSGGNSSGSTSPVTRPLSPLAAGPGFPSSYRSGAKSLPPPNLESGAKTITQESIKTEDREHT